MYMTHRLIKALQKTVKLNNSGIGIQCGRDIINSNITQQITANIIQSSLPPGPALEYTINSTIEPSLPSNYVSRDVDIDYLIEQYKTHNLLYLYGSRYSGKSVLSLSLAKALKKQMQWISFDGSTAVCYTLQGYGVRYIKKSFNINKYNGFSHYKLKKNSILVIDNFPYDHNNDSDINLINDLILSNLTIGNLICINSIKIGCSPKYCLQNFVTYRVKPISKRDIMKYLVDNGKGQYAKLLYNITFGQPVLLRLLLDYLDKQSWNMEDINMIDAIVRGGYASTNTDYVKKEFINLSTSSDARKLIYRLDLLTEIIDKTVIQQVSQVNPSISNLDVVLSQLDGVWLERIDHRFRISDLLKGIGQKELTESELYDIYTSRITAILEKQDPRCVNRLFSNPLIVYSMKVCNYDLLISESFRITMALLNASNELLSIAADELLILSFWTSMPMTPSIPIKLQVQFRMFQYSIYVKLGKDCTYIKEDLIKLLNLVKEYDLITVMTLLGLLIKIDCMDVELYLEIIKVLIHNESELELVIKSHNGEIPPPQIKYSTVNTNGELDVSEMMLDYFWIKSLEFNEIQIDKVFSISLNFTKKEKERIFYSKSFIGLVFRIFENIYVLLYQMPKGKKNIDFFLDILNKAELIAKEVGINSMTVAIAKARMIIYGEELKNIDRVSMIYHEIIKAVPDLSDLDTYHIYSTFATQIYLTDGGLCQDNYAYSLYEISLLLPVELEDETYYLDKYFQTKRLAHLVVRNKMDDKIPFVVSKLTMLIDSQLLKTSCRIDCLSVLAAIYYYQGKIKETVSILIKSYETGLIEYSFNPETYSADIQSQIILSSLFIKYLYQVEINGYSLEDYPEEERGLPLTFDFLWRSYPLLDQAWTPDYMINSMTIPVSIFSLLKQYDKTIQHIVDFYAYYVHNNKLISQSESLYVLHKSFLRIIMECGFYNDIKDDVKSIIEMASDLAYEASLLINYLDAHNKRNTS